MPDDDRRDRKITRRKIERGSSFFGDKPVLGKSDPAGSDPGGARGKHQVKGVRAIAQEIEVSYPSDKKTGDDEIAKRAVSILQWDAVVPQGAIDVTVQRGWVTLAGVVNWQYQRKAAEDAIMKLSGVNGVINNIALKPAVHVSDVQKQIEDALSRHAKFEAHAIRVSVRDGNKVALEGKVESWDERDAVEDAAWSVPGVQSVDDRLTITP